MGQIALRIQAGGQKQKYFGSQNLGITIGGQKLSTGRFLIAGAGRGLTSCLPKFASAFWHIQRKQVYGILHEMHPTLVCVTAWCFSKRYGAFYPNYGNTQDK